MPHKRSIKLRCPICKKLVRTADADFPFCSDRCRSIDLGRWASGGYVVPSKEPTLEVEVPGPNGDAEDEP